jgi:hypothetical protein
MNTNAPSCICELVFRNIIGQESQWFWGAVAAIAVAWTLGLIYQQVKLQRLGNMLTSLGEFNGRWRSAETVKSRKEICNCFLKREPCKTAALEDVAGFFEEIGVYLEREVFDCPLVWDIYGSYVENYWLILKPAILDLRGIDPTAYTSFEKLYDRCAAHSVKNGTVESGLTADDLKEFAKSEAKDAVGIALGISQT